MDVVSPVVQVFAASPSSSSSGCVHILLIVGLVLTESFSHHRALTPLISGAVSGGLVGIAWIIGFIIYFYKRHRREKRARALGFRGHREMLDPPKKKEAFIIPPDPAIVESGLIPGERIYDDDPALADEEIPKHARNIQFTRFKDGSKESTTTTGSAPTFTNRQPAPTRVAYVAPPSLSRTSSKGYDRLPLTPLSTRKSTGSADAPQFP